MHVKSRRIGRCLSSKHYTDFYTKNVGLTIFLDFWLRLFKSLCSQTTRSQAGSFLNLGDEITAELSYNEHLKITLEFPVLKANAVVYRAFTVVPSQGVYQVLNEFDYF